MSPLVDVLIVVAIAATGFGVAIPLCNRWTRQQREREKRERQQQDGASR